MRVLVVEDDDLLRDGLEVGLRLKGFVIDSVATVADADAVLINHSYEAAIFDLMLPDGSGLDILRALRSRGDAVPVLLLTARDSTADRIGGLDSGADDYLGKPFDLDEVAARLRALIRRAAGRIDTLIRHGELCLDPARQSIERNGEPIRLSRREFAVLQLLMSQPGRILSKSQIEQQLYGWQEDIESNAVEVHVHHLRNKLGSGAIETVRGLGYRMGASG